MKPAANSLEGKAASFIERIERLDGEIEHLKNSIADDIKSAREDKKETLEEAKSAGVPPKALKAEIKRRAVERKLATTLTVNELALYRGLADSLGPLGEAAAERAGYGKNGEVRA
jgi:uncharacterized protein (UPF0335 family)